jgi:hypothetical protein
MLQDSVSSCNWHELEASDWIFVFLEEKSIESNNSPKILFGIFTASCFCVHNLTPHIRTPIQRLSALAHSFVQVPLMTADEALRIHLVNSLHGPDALEAAVLAKLAQITASSQWTARKVKQVVAMILNGQAAETDQTKAWILDAVEGPDFAEGRAAFMEKRSPSFPFR